MNSGASSDLVFLMWIIISVYAAITVFISVRGALKTKNMNDYALGTVNFSPVAVGLALAASMTSAATFIINPGFVALYGISAVISYGIVLPAAAMGSLIFLTWGFRKYGSAVKAQTMAQWMGKRYESKSYALFFAFLSLLLIAFIVLINVGITKVLAKSLNLPEVYVLLALTIFIFGYMMFGGANTMVYTNTVQAVLMLIVAFILLTSGYQHFSQGVTGFLDKLSAVDPKLTGLTNSSSFLFRDFFEIVISQIVIGVAIICQPHIITKSLLIKSDAGVKKYLTVGVIVQTIFFWVVFTGLYARLAFPDLMYNGTALKMDGIIPAYVVKEFPVYVSLLVVMGLIAAGISTLEGLIQSVSTTITTDLVKPVFMRNITDESAEKKLPVVNKLVIIVIAVVSFFLSYDQLLHPKLSVAIFGQNGVYAYFSAAFVPILFGMFVKNVRRIVVVTASVIAIIIHFTMYYGKIQIPFSVATGENPGVAAATAIIISVITALAIHKFTGRRGDNV